MNTRIKEMILGVLALIGILAFMTIIGFLSLGFVANLDKWVTYW